MKRAVGFVVFLLLLGGAIVLGLASAPDVMKPRSPQAPARGLAKHEFAVWPEDSLAEAEIACEEEGEARSQPWDITRRFVEEVLGWGYWDVPYSSFDQYGATFRVNGSPQTSPSIGSVQIYATDVLPGCYSVFSVHPTARLDFPDPVVSLRGRDFEIGFAILGADSLAFEIGHGPYVMGSDPEPPDGRITVLLTYRPNQSGHFLILFRNEDGDVFTAFGTPMPAGTFAAG